MSTSVAPRPSLAPYVSRVVREWLGSSDPEAMHRRIDGTAVFVDVSGFTQMSERMARLGKAGAEEVTKIIGDSFSDLLEDANGYGGTLLKFGGDALLLFFRGDDHELRGAAAALAMRATLRRIGKFDTPVGKVTLRMSVGIHSGPFDFFLVGTSHRELLIAGPCATKVVAAEGEADAGQILVSEATASAMPKHNLGPDRNQGRLLRGRIDAPRDDVESRDFKEDLDVTVPSMLREQALAGAGQAEHRTTVVAFIDVGGFDKHLEVRGPDYVAAELHSMISDIDAAADAHGIAFLGSDVDVDGFKVILTAGAPLSTGADEESMLLALRDIVAVDRDHEIKIGVNRGPVFAGEVGTRFRRAYTVMGDTVNLAARVMARAEPGQILATQPVLDGSRTLFETTAVEPFLVKGKKDLVVTSVVGEPMGARSTVAGSDLPLIGRDREMGVLLSAWEKAKASQGQVVEISADVGMGKSRLLAEFLRQGEVDDLVDTECRLYQATTAYFPFRGLLRKVLGLADVGAQRLPAELERIVGEKAPDLLPWLSLVGTVADVEIVPSEQVRELDDEFRRLRLKEVTTELFKHAVSTPTVFVIEDCQWMDEASNDLLNRLIDPAPEMPWLIILNRRPGDSGFLVDDPDALTLLDLAPLSQEPIRELILEATRSTPLRTEQVETLALRAEGSPLFLIELVEALQRSDDADALPDSLEGLIRARIDTLDPADRDLLQRVSVLGSNFQSHHVTAVLPLSQSEIDTRLRSVPEFLTLDRDAQVYFRQALAHEVAYEGMPYKLRRQLHAQVAESMRSEVGDGHEEQSELLSLHFFEAGRWDETLEFSLKAGAKSEAVYANLEAATFYERALTAARRIGTSSDSEVAALSEARGDALEHAGLFDESLDAYGLALRRSKSKPVYQADLMLKRARLRAYSGSYSSGLAELTRAKRLLESANSKKAQVARARIDSFQAVIRMMQGRSEHALRLAEEALIEAAEAGEKEAMARAYMVIDAACLTLGRAVETDYLPRAMEMYQETGDLLGVALVANNMGERAWFEGRFDDAIELFTTAYDTNKRAGNDPQAANNRANIAEVMIAQGQTDIAKAILEDSSRVLHAHGSEWAVLADIHLARIELENGQGDAAIKMLENAVSDATEMGQTEWVHMGSIYLADAHADQGDLETALELLNTAETSVDQGGNLYGPLVAMVKTKVLRALGREGEALECAIAGRNIAGHLMMEYQSSQLDQLVTELSN